MLYVAACMHAYIYVIAFLKLDINIDTIQLARQIFVMAVFLSIGAGVAVRRHAPTGGPAERSGMHFFLYVASYYREALKYL